MNKFNFDDTMSDHEILIELIDFYHAMRAEGSDKFFEKTGRHITAQRLREFETSMEEMMKEKMSHE